MLPVYTRAFAPRERSERVKLYLVDADTKESTAAINVPYSRLNGSEDIVTMHQTDIVSGTRLGGGSRGRRLGSSPAAGLLLFAAVVFGEREGSGYYRRPSPGASRGRIPPRCLGAPSDGRLTCKNLDPDRFPHILAILLELCNLCPRPCIRLGAYRTRDVVAPVSVPNGTAVTRVSPGYGGGVLLNVQTIGRIEKDFISGPNENVYTPLTVSTTSIRQEVSAQSRRG